MRTWQKPNIIVLTRGHPEERVLENCKGFVGGGPIDSNSQCDTKCKDGCLQIVAS